MLDATLAIHSARNSGWRSGAQAPEAAAVDAAVDGAVGDFVDEAGMAMVQQARYVTRRDHRARVMPTAQAWLAAALAVCIAMTARAEELRNWFNDPFAQATQGLAACPAPLGPLMTEADARRQAHPRIERGNSCYLAGKCDSPNAYAHDGEINAAVVAALAQDARLRASAIWVTTQRKFVFLQGCVADRASIARAITLARAVKGVQYVGDELMVGTRGVHGKPPYPLRSTQP
jgi:hypothetical protein